MLSLLDVLVGLVAVALGSMVFFSFVMAPLIFIRLPPEVSGPFIRQVFPVYYLSLAVVTASAAALGLRSHRFEAAVLLVVSVGFVLARQVLMPAINRRRDAQLRGDAGAENNGFALLHRLSVLLNYLQLAGVGLVLVRLVA